MNTSYQIQEIDYSLINKAVNLDGFKRNLLMGHFRQYVAIRQVSGGIEIIIETIGKRDVCAKKLQDYLDTQNSLA